jgi:hypothetical protein
LRINSQSEPYTSLLCIEIGPKSCLLFSHGHAHRGCGRTVRAGVAIYAYFTLAIENTYGADDGLVTTGLYRDSRNPQFVASIAGFRRSRPCRGQRGNPEPMRTCYKVSMWLCRRPKNPGYCASTVKAIGSIAL